MQGVHGAIKWRLLGQYVLVIYNTIFRNATKKYFPEPFLVFSISFIVKS